MIKNYQIRAARALINISQAELAEISTVSIGTVKKIELSEGYSCNLRTIMKIKEALENRGVEFIAEDGVYGVLLCS